MNYVSGFSESAKKAIADLDSEMLDKAILAVQKEYNQYQKIADSLCVDVKAYVACLYLLEDTFKVSTIHAQSAIDNMVKNSKSEPS